MVQVASSDGGTGVRGGRNDAGDARAFDAAVDRARTDAATDPRARAATPPRPDPGPNDAPPGPPPAPPAVTPPEARPAGAGAPPPARTAPDPAVMVPQARQEQIATQARTGTQGGFWFWEPSAADKVKDGLTGKSPLGAMTADEQRLFVDRTLDQWGNDPGKVHDLAMTVRDDPALSPIVSERLAARAATRQTDAARGPEETTWKAEDQASALAMASVHAAGGGMPGEPASPDAKSRLAATVEGLGPERAAAFGSALAASPGDLAGTLEAVNDAPRTTATSAFVQGAFLSAGGRAYDSANLSREMGEALGREWYPDHPAAAASEGERMAAILGTVQGRELLTSLPELTGAPPEARLEALATLRAHPEITAETLSRTDSGWTNPALTTAMFETTAQRYAGLRGDAPVAYSGTQVENTVGFAMGFQPRTPEGMTEAQVQSGVADGTLSLYANGREGEAVRTVSDQIRAVGGDAPQVTVLPIQYSGPESGPVQLPLFRVTDAAGQERYVDNLGRRYDSFEDWKANNQLPPGNVTYPEGGHLTTAPNGDVALASGNTARTPDTAGERIANALDGALLVGGIVAGGLVIVGSGGTAAPVVAAVAAGWGAYRSGSELVDRGNHGQDINPFTNSEARGLWLDVAANGLGVAAFGTAVRGASLLAANRTLTPLEATVTSVLRIGANAADVAAIGNTGVALYTNWDTLSTAQKAEMGLSMAFWGVSSLANARGRPRDLFDAPAMRQHMLEDLRPDVGVRLSREDAQAAISRSPQFQQMKADLEADGWTFQFSERMGSGSFADRATKTVTLDPRDFANGNHDVTTVLAHEMGHAAYDYQWLPPRSGMSRDDFIRWNVNRHLMDEAEATLVNLEVRDQVLSAGGPAIPVSGQNYARYMEIFEQYKVDGNRAAARLAIANEFGGEHPSTNPALTYQQYYATPYEKYWADHYGNATVVP